MAASYLGKPVRFGRDQGGAVQLTLVVEQLGEGALRDLNVLDVEPRRHGDGQVQLLRQLQCQCGSPRVPRIAQLLELQDKVPATQLSPGHVCFMPSVSTLDYGQRAVCCRHVSGSLLASYTAPYQTKSFRAS